MASFTPTAHVWGCTGALNAAAAVVMRTVDANAGVGVGQRGLCVTSIMDRLRCAWFESSAESNAGDAACRYPEDALDVSNAPRLRCNSP